MQDHDQNLAGENAPVEQAESVTDLDGLSRFTYQGQEYTPEMLSKVFGEHKTYSQQFEESRKLETYEKNLRIDLENVRQDPRLAQRFRETYPNKYHSYLDLVLREDSTGAPPATKGLANSLPKEFMDEFGQLKGQLSQMMEESHQAKVDAAMAKIDATLPPLMEKFPLALEDQVLTRAEAYIASGQKMTEKTWERFARESHEAIEKRSSKHMSAKMKEQMERAKQGRDTAPGGAAPGQAPVKPRSFAEAQEALIAHIKSGQGR